MSYYKMIDNFLGHMDRMRAHDVHDLLKEDERKARHFQVEIGVEYRESFPAPLNGWINDENNTKSLNWGASILGVFRRFDEH